MTAPSGAVALSPAQAIPPADIGMLPPPPPEPVISDTPVLPGPPNADTGPGDPGNRFYISAEYLLWWFKKSHVPVPLVTTTSRPDLTPTAALGQDGTSILLGNQNLDTSTRHGGRITAGLWCDDRREIGVEASYFFLASHTVTQSVSSSGEANAPILAVPFFADDLGMETTFVLASPSTLAGAATLSLTSRLQGAELNGAVRVCRGGAFGLDVLAGFRFVELRENLSFATTSLGIESPGAGSNNGLILNTLDQFNTHNRFYGGQLGVRAEYRMGDLFVGARAKLALGDMHQVALIDGSATTNFFNAPAGGPFTGVPTQILPGSGIFAQPTNIGRTSRHEFEAVPEIGVSVGYEFMDGVRAFVGYDLLYLSSVLRPGNQIDRTITFSQTLQNTIAGNASAPGDRPIVPLAGSSFWAQGVNFGVEWRY
jgi:hypothetical protein